MLVNIIKFKIMKKNNSNIFSLTIHYINPMRPGSNKGDRNFNTTKKIRNIRNLTDAILLLGDLKIIRKAYYNGRLIAVNGDLLKKYKTIL